MFCLFIIILRSTKSQRINFYSQIPVDPDPPGNANGDPWTGRLQGSVQGIHGLLPGHRAGPHGDWQAHRRARGQQVVG